MNERELLVLASKLLLPVDNEYIDRNNCSWSILSVAGDIIRADGQQTLDGEHSRAVAALEIAAIM